MLKRRNAATPAVKLIPAEGVGAQHTEQDGKQCCADSDEGGVREHRCHGYAFEVTAQFCPIGELGKKALRLGEELLSAAEQC